MNILLNGALGKMGEEVIKAVEKNKNFKIICGFDTKEENKEFPVYNDIKEIKEVPDVIIDFSKPEGSLEILKYAKENKIDMKGKIAFEFDLAPFKPSEQKSSHGVKTIALHHYFDRIAGIKDLPGADNYIERREVPVGKRNILSLSIQEHGVDSFGQEEIKKYIDKFSDK